MCKYIKDNGEQCGRDTQPFCHDHEDTAQATLWGEIEDVRSEVSSIASESECGSDSSSEGHTTCDRCEQPVSLSVTDVDQMQMIPERAEVGISLACACGETAVPMFKDVTIYIEDIPGEWT